MTSEGKGYNTLRLICLHCDGVTATSSIFRLTGSARLPILEFDNIIEFDDGIDGMRGFKESALG